MAVGIEGPSLVAGQERRSGQFGLVRWFVVAARVSWDVTAVRTVIGASMFGEAPSRLLRALVYRPGGRGRATPGFGAAIRRWVGYPRPAVVNRGVGRRRGNIAAHDP